MEQKKRILLPYSILFARSVAQCGMNMARPTDYLIEETKDIPLKTR
jgi:hypothetical protein